MGIFLLFISILIWILWARDIQRGKIDEIHFKPIHNTNLAIIPFLFSIILLIIGIIILVI